MARNTIDESDRALDLFESSLQTSVDLGDRAMQAGALNNIGQLHDHKDRPRRAIEYYQRSLTIAEELGDRHGVAIATGNMGLALAHLAALEKDTRFLQETEIELKKAMGIFRDLGDLEGIGNTLNGLGNVSQMSGDITGTTDYYVAYLPIARQLGNQRGEADALWNRALARYELGHREEAIADANLALGLNQQVEAPAVNKVRQKLAEWQTGD
jgi:tetratricopeptide (TPR) repeat protein